MLVFYLCTHVHYRTKLFILHHIRNVPLKTETVKKLHSCVLIEMYNINTSSETYSITLATNRSD